MQDHTIPGRGATVMGVIGVVGYALAGVLYLSSGLMVPAPWLVVLWVIWLLGIYPLVVVFRTRRAWTLLVAVGAVIIWWVYVTIGGAIFDWTA